METLKLPIKTTNGNVYNAEDMMSIPTSITRKAIASPVVEEAEMLLAA
jgi:hypothetical protein